VTRWLIVGVLGLVMVGPVVGQEADILIQRERPPEQAFLKPPEWYVQAIKMKIAERRLRWSTRTESIRNLAVTVVVEIGRNGTLQGARVERTSGEKAFDAAAVRAVQDAGPFPPLPESHGAQGARLTVEFREGAGPAQ